METFIGLHIKLQISHKINKIKFKNPLKQALKNDFKTVFEDFFMLIFKFSQIA